MNEEEREYPMKFPEYANRDSNNLNECTTMVQRCATSQRRGDEVLEGRE